MKKILKYKWVAVGVILGIAGGYLYYYFIGCNTGSCPITSKPLNSMVYGGVMGGLFLSLLQGRNKNPDKDS